MGTLYYSGLGIDFDDRLLEHLHIVIVMKLRRGESFSMSWVDDRSIGDGRSSIWLHPASSIYFKFAGSRLPSINRAWIEHLLESANSSTGLVVTDEGGALARGKGIPSGHGSTAGMGR
jgi:hypothetical protein